MNKTTKKICFTAMFAAMVFGLTMLHVPIGAGGYIHVGDAVIYICALLLGGPWAFVSAAIGAACADLASGYAVYAIPSAIIKLLVAVPFVLVRKKSEKLFSVRTVVCALASGCITVLGYFCADLIVYRAGAVADIPANLIQALGSAAVFLAAALVMDRVGLRRKFEKELSK